MFALWPTACLYRPSSPPLTVTQIISARRDTAAVWVKNTESRSFKPSHLKVTSAAPFVSLLPQRGQADSEMSDAFSEAFKKITASAALEPALDPVFLICFMRKGAPPLPPKDHPLLGSIWIKGLALLFHRRDTGQPPFSEHF